MELMMLTPTSDVTTTEETLDQRAERLLDLIQKYQKLGLTRFPDEAATAQRLVLKEEIETLLKDADLVVHLANSFVATTIQQKFFGNLIPGVDLSVVPVGDVMVRIVNGETVEKALDVIRYLALKVEVASEVTKGQETLCDAWAEHLFQRYSSLLKAGFSEVMAQCLIDGYMKANNDPLKVISGAMSNIKVSK